MLIYTIANASLEEHPDNVLTEYVNELPHPIRASDGKKLAIGLKALFINSRLKPDTKVGYISVFLQELEGQLGEETFSKRVANIPFKRSSELDQGHGLHYVVNSPQHLLLDIAVLSKLSILIADQTGDRLPLSAGHPTIVIFDVIEMEGDRQFSVICNSQTSLETHPDNDSSNFTFEFGREIDLPGTWEVAMKSIVLPPNVRADFGPCELILGDHCIVLDPLDYPDVYAMIEEIQQYISSDVALVNEFEFMYNEANEMWQIVRHVLNWSAPDTGESLNIPEVRQVVISPCLNYILEGKYARREYEFPDRSAVSMHGMPLLERVKINTVVFYADLVGDSWLGTTPVPLLEIVPLGKLQDKMDAYEEDIIAAGARIGTPASLEALRRKLEPGTGPMSERYTPFSFSDFLVQKVMTYEHISKLMVQARAEKNLEDMPQMYLPKQLTYHRLKQHKFSSIKFACRSVDGTPVNLKAGLGPSQEFLSRDEDEEEEEEEEEGDEEEGREKEEKREEKVARLNASYPVELSLLFTKVD